MNKKLNHLIFSLILPWLMIVGLVGAPAYFFMKPIVVPVAVIIVLCLSLKELNLSETSFVIPATRADCAAGVRIFTPEKEMAFAGHPTIGTSFVLLDEGIVPADRDQSCWKKKSALSRFVWTQAHVR